MNADDRLYFRQLLAGRDFARDDPIARQMVNFVYLIGDRETGEAVVDRPGVRRRTSSSTSLAADGMRLTGALATHYHPDHVGGDMMGYSHRGRRASCSRSTTCAVPVHVQRDEAEWVKRSTGALRLRPRAARQRRRRDGRRHPDHADAHARATRPGSQCFLVDGRLVAGDTLFLEGCGRTDLPGGDPDAMYESLTQRLAKVPDDTVLFPGHLYSPEPSATMGETRAAQLRVPPPRARAVARLHGRLQARADRPEHLIYSSDDPLHR